MSDNISNNIDGIISGINKVTSVIKPTYGAAGSNIVLEESLYPFHSIRNDGKAIVDKIKLSDPIENIGANIIREAGDKIEKESGDGRKTTMIILDAILNQAQNTNSLIPTDLKKSLIESMNLVLENIDSQKRPIEIKDVQAVATIASENEELGATIKDIYEQIGKEGIIEIENSNLPKTYYEITEGVKLRGAGSFGEYSNTEPGKAIYKNPKILISKDKITSINQIERIVDSLMKASITELVIYCEDIDMSVASRLAYTHLNGGFKTLIIKSPTLWKDWLFEDLAAITGAMMVDSKEGKTFKSLNIQDLGTCEKIITTKEETRVIGIKDISSHIQHLEELAKTNDQIELRIAWLKTKAAILKVGANSESELSYISKKAHDACHAAYLALKDGVVAGGGVSLFKAAQTLPSTVGGLILQNALKAPIQEIIKNAEFEYHEETLVGPDVGLDAKNGVFVNMFDKGIIDPAIVVKNAVKAAVSIASTIITANGIITLPK